MCRYFVRIERAAILPSAGIILSADHHLLGLSEFVSCTRASDRRASFLQTLIGRTVMKTRYTVTLAMLAGFAIGAVAIQGLHAQAKPPVYYIAEIDVNNLEAYVKEYAPLAQASIKAAGG